MEELEKRKVRLKAIREEAAEAGDNNEEQNSIGEPLDHGLANPLIETPSAFSGKDEPRPRFDCYTDPMAASSVNNIKNNLSPQVSQLCNAPPSTIDDLVPSNNRSSDYGTSNLGIITQCGGGVMTKGNAVIGVEQIASGSTSCLKRQPSYAIDADQGQGPMNAGSPAYHAQGNHNSVQRTYRPRGVNAIPLGIRRKSSPSCTPPGNSSNTLDSSLGTPNNYSPPDSLLIGDNSSHDSPQVCGAGSQHGQGSPYQGSGFRTKAYRGSRGGGRRSKFYYHESMVEDPWKALKPVTWKPRDNTQDSLKPWLPNSIRTKRAKLGETPTKFTPQRSLAEYLAAAFNEAAGEDTE